MKKQYPEINKEIGLHGASFIGKLVNKSAVYRLVQPGILKLRIILGLTNGVSPVYFGELEFNSLFKEPITSFIFEEVERISKIHSSALFFYLHPDIIETKSYMISNYCDIVNCENKDFDKLVFHRNFYELFEKLNLNYLNIFESFEKKSDGFNTYLLPRDPHLDTKGVDVLATTVSEAIFSNCGKFDGEKLVCD